jgi:hypothetical protein
METSCPAGLNRTPGISRLPHFIASEGRIAAGPVSEIAAAIVTVERAIAGLL